MKRYLLTALLAALCGFPKVQGACSYSFSPGSLSAAAAGATGSASLTASCAWTAASTNSWIHPGGSGSGNGTVTYTVDANLLSSPRTGAITAGNKTFVINQAAPPIPLGQVLDNTNLTWTTSNPYPWISTNPPAPTFDGVNSAVSGNRGVPNSVSWLQTTVVGPGTITFWWKVDSDVTPPLPDPPVSYDSLEFLIDGSSQSQIMGQIDWNYRTFDIPAGSHVLQWQYTKDAQYNSGGDQAWLDQVIYTTNAPIALQSSLNTCGVNWTSGGNTNETLWAGQAAVSHDGQTAAQSGSVFVNQESWMQAVVSGVTNLSFWWKVSSQTNYDFLEFYTNNVLARRVSGEAAWQSNFFRFNANTTNTLKWRYAKTNFVIVAQGSNAGWVDQVALAPMPKALPFTLSTPGTLPDGRPQVTVQGESTCPCQLQVSPDLNNWSPLTNFTLTNGIGTIIDSAATNYSSRYYRTLSL